MDKKILIRFGDLMLKGKNIGFFIKAVRQHVKNSLRNYEVKYAFMHDRMYVIYQESDEEIIIEALKKIPGIYSISIVHNANRDIDDIVKVSVEVLNKYLKDAVQTIKIDTKRADKNFPYTSLEFTQMIAPKILNAYERKMVVDVHHPDQILHIEIRKEQTFIYLNQIMMMGGYPYGVAGKGLMMMSGGLDSPIAAFLAIKQGIEVELIHFESTPLTPLESVQKVLDLAKILSSYTTNQSIKCHLVPFVDLHTSLLKDVYEPYIITVMRRMMYRIAEKFANEQNCLCLLNGESVGQVASQTLESMKVIEEVTVMPILRPLITYDKLEIIALAKNIGSYDISIRPFNDCCSVYVPKNPVTKPKSHYAFKYESYVDMSLVDQAVSQIITIEVTPNQNFKIYDYGFDVKEAVNAYLKERDEFID
ncbi:MAG: tRNA uracil 4-sulfurtransferase ThiI [Acholeplasmataceae bacterium]